MPIGEIEFFGYEGIDLNKVRAALPFHEGDEFRFETMAETMERALRAIKQVTGKQPPGLGPTCCDDQGRLIFFIGLSGKTIHYNPSPKGSARLPSSITNLYQQFMDTVQESTRKGITSEDRSKGYPLSSYPSMRAAQLKMRAYAVGHERLLINVLKSAAEDEQRIAAAEVLGFARQSKAQINALVHASRDSNETVRNNATRALVVLVESKPELAKQIPAEGFIELLFSDTWTDLNKAGSLLADLTISRDPKLLARLNQPEVISRLIEMARWRTGHAQAARMILGRIAGIEEMRLRQLSTTGQTDVILDALKNKK